MYPAELVQPMKEDLTNVGFIELTNSAEVDQTIQNTEGLLLVVVNSVCGCAAGAARPGVIFSLTGDKKPDQLTTVFAGFDKDAVAEARKFLSPFCVTSCRAVQMERSSAS